MMLFAIAAGLTASDAKTINCASCSQDDFETAYYRDSAPGDTIVLPAGVATWGKSSRFNAGVIYIITNVIVKGQGDSTVITLDDTGKTYNLGVIALWSAATFKSMKFIGSSAAPVTAFQIEAYGAFTGGFRLTDITYEGGKSDGYFAYIGGGVKNGVIDNCRVTAGVDYTELIFSRGTSNAWQSPNTMGGADNIFVEDCTFGDHGYICDANANARMVIRYNTINGPSKIDGHGLASNNPARGVRNMEVYGNTWTKTGAGNWANIELRGGTGMVFNNSCVTGWAFLKDYAYDAEPHGWPNFGFGGTSVAGNPTVITTNAPHNYKTGWPIWVQAPYGDSGGTIYNTYTITVTSPNTFSIPFDSIVGGNIDFATAYKTPNDYPIKDQIGNGMDGAPREPVYWFGNTKAGAAWPRNLTIVCASANKFYQAQTGNPAATFTERDVIRANRDFFADSGFDTDTGVSTGTAAQMRAMTPSISGYGFWVTDEGEWNSKHPGPDGRLYTWTGTAWVLKYTPFPYPHPLAATPPAAPGGLKAVRIK